MVKTEIFVMEGLLMFLAPETVGEVLSFIAKNSDRGSAIIFDYYSQSVVDGSCELEAGKEYPQPAGAIGRAA
jgi:O-methyltransferase involved in polyketide biosynthesis